MKDINIFAATKNLCKNLNCLDLSQKLSFIQSLTKQKQRERGISPYNKCFMPSDLQVGTDNLYPECSSLVRLAESRLPGREIGVITTGTCHKPSAQPQGITVQNASGNWTCMVSLPEILGNQDKIKMEPSS